MSVPHSGSFRDPDGRVFEQDNRVFRGLSASGAAHYRKARDTGLLGDLEDNGLIVISRPVELTDVPDGVPNELVIEADRLPFMTYPYEWSFAMLRDAALLTLEVTEVALRRGFQLKDASAFNVGFVASGPVFIDLGSLEPGFDGAWIGYAQFVDHFLVPLMIEAHLGLPFQRMLRGYLEGIPVEEAARLLGGRHRLKKGVAVHLALRARLERSARKMSALQRTEVRQGMALPVEAVISRLKKMGDLIRDLSSSAPSHWTDYEDSHSYEAAELAAKEAFVRAAAAEVKPTMAWDIGANTGRFSRVLTEHAGVVIAMESDSPTVDRLVEGLRTNPAPIIPVVSDVTDPSPRRGWNLSERLALSDRGEPDMAIWLAVIHHVCLSRGVPLPMVLDLVAATSPYAVIEFVDPGDPMSRELLATRKEIPHGYSKELFDRSVADRFEVIRSVELKPTRHLLFVRALS